MSNITFKADDEIIKKARKAAIEKNTTLVCLAKPGSWFPQMLGMKGPVIFVA